MGKEHRLCVVGRSDPGEGGERKREGERQLYWWRLLTNLWWRWRKLAPVQYPDAYHAVCAPLSWQPEVVQKFDILRYGMRGEQGDDVELLSPVLSSLSPRKDESMPTAKKK